MLHQQAMNEDVAAAYLAKEDQIDAVIAEVDDIPEEDVVIRQYMTQGLVLNEGMIPVFLWDELRKRKLL
jgi:hypothetical protein